MTISLSYGPESGAPTLTVTGAPTVTDSYFTFLKVSLMLMYVIFSQNQKDLVVLSRQCCLFCLLKS